MNRGLEHLLLTIGLTLGISCGSSPKNPYFENYQARPYEVDEWLSLSLESQNLRNSQITQSLRNSHHAGQLQLPGKCLKPHPPEGAENAVVRSTSSTQPSAEIVKEILQAKYFDLDGDGNADPLVGLTGHCTLEGACAFALYVSRKNCGHLVGTLWAENARLRLFSSSHGLADLETLHRNDRFQFQSLYRFDGTSYQKIAERSASIKSEDWSPWKRIY